jgi:threonine/homoserine efflux transporter RhtA
MFTENFVLDSAVLMAIALITAGFVLAWPRQPETAEKLGLAYAFVAGTCAAIQILYLLGHLSGFDAPHYESKALLVLVIIGFALACITYLTLLAGPLLFALWCTCLVFGDRPPKTKPPQSEEHHG